VLFRSLESRIAALEATLAGMQQKMTAPAVAKTPAPAPVKTETKNA